MAFPNGDIRIPVRGEKPSKLGSWTDWQLSSGQNIQWPQDLHNWVEVSITTSNPPGRSQKRAKQIIRYQSKHPLLGNRTYRSKENFFSLILFYNDCRYHDITLLNPSVCISKTWVVFKLCCITFLFEKLLKAGVRENKYTCNVLWGFQGIHNFLESYPQTLMQNLQQREIWFCRVIQEHSSQQMSSLVGS